MATTLEGYGLADVSHFEGIHTPTFDWTYRVTSKPLWKLLGHLQYSASHAGRPMGGYRWDWEEPEGFQALAAPLLEDIHKRFLKRV